MIGGFERGLYRCVLWWGRCMGGVCVLDGEGVRLLPWRDGLLFRSSMLEVMYGWFYQNQVFTLPSCPTAVKYGNFSSVVNEGGDDGSGKTVRISARNLERSSGLSRR